MSGSSIGPVGRSTDAWATRTGHEPPDEALFQAHAQAARAGQAGQTSPQYAGPSAGEVALDLTQLTLDVAGIFDPTPISDGSNAVISLFRGDWSGAAISGVSMVPYIGDTAKLAKLPRLAETLGKVADLVRANPAAAAVLREGMEKLGALLNKAPIDSLPEAVRGPVQAVKTKFDEAMVALRSSEAPTSQQPAVPVGAADGATGGGPATGAGTGSAGARGAEDGPPPAAAGGAGGGDGPVDGGGGSRPTAGGPDGPDRAALITELVDNGVKVTPEDVLKVEKLPDGRIVFLEKGNSASGLQHIVEGHGAEFAQAGIPESEIPDFLMQALRDGDVVGQQGRGAGRPIYEVEYEGRTLRVAITTGNNGYVVGANMR